MTPWQSNRAADVGLKRLKREHNLAMAAAWHAGMLPRVKDPPPLEKLLLKDEPQTAQRPGAEDPARIAALHSWLMTHKPVGRG